MALPARPCGVHELAQGAGFAARDCVCELGARSPVSVGAYRRAGISVILAGTFHVRASAGAALIGPGGLLLGNAASGYEFRHVDDGGDRSLVLAYDDALLDEVARAHEVRVRGARWFRGAALPATPATAEVAVLAHRALCSGDPEALREAALAAAGAAIAADGGGAPSSPPPAQARRVARALRYIEAHSAGDCSLEALAAHAGLSRYHFLRVFRAITGQTPRQHVIATRLRAAATALRTTRQAITGVALDAGFGDLSHFTTSFSLAFGVSPRAYRARVRRRG